MTIEKIKLVNSDAFQLRQAWIFEQISLATNDDDISLSIKFYFGVKSAGDTNFAMIK
jgi:hypothetical protein